MMVKSRIMYIECKDGGLAGPARIGRVMFSKSGQSLYYGGKRYFRASGFKSNYMEEGTSDEYWISGCRKDGMDALYNTDVEIDEDVREEYWTEIRNCPEKIEVRAFRALGKCC